MFYLKSRPIPRSSWTQAVVQTVNAEEQALRSLLIQNIVAAVVIGSLLILVDRLTIGQDQEKLAQSANTDNLSGLLNRQMFTAIFEKYTRAGSGSHPNLANALMEIDDFKRLNDTYGHAAGDAVIRAVAATIKGSMREGDPVFRWGEKSFWCSCQQRTLITPEFVWKRCVGVYAIWRLN